MTAFSGRRAIIRCLVLLVLAVCGSSGGAHAAVNKALHFDGTDDFVLLPTNHRKPCPVTDFTIECWVKTTSGGTVFGAYKNINMGIDGSSAQLTYWVGDNHGRLYIPTAQYAGQWMYLAYVRKGSKLTGYVNGTAVDSMTGPSGTFDMFSGWGGQSIGAYPPDTRSSNPGQCFSGTMDEMRISATARSASEIAANWNGGSGRFMLADTATLALWHFDEGEGDMLHDVITWNNGFLGWYQTGDSTRYPAWTEGVPFPGPTADLSLYVPPVHARLGIPVKVLVTGVSSGDRFSASLTGPGVDRIVHEQEGPLPMSLTFRLSLRDLDAGDYVITARILDAGDTEIRSTVHRFTKIFDGDPANGIDEFNALVVDGRQVFPFGAYQLYLDRIPGWAQNGYVNCQNGQAGFGGATPFSTTLDVCTQQSLGMIGGIEVWTADEVTPIVEAHRGHDAMWAWGLHDEPDLNGKSAIELQALTAAAHAADPLHPVWVNNMGHSFSGSDAFWTGIGVSYSYPNLVADMYCFDYYPVLTSSEPERNTTFDAMLLDLADVICDHIRDWNHDLIPIHSFVECTQFSADYNEPTPRQIRVMTWVNIVHGIKGIMWFPWHWLDAISDGNFAEMARLVEEVTRLSPVIFEPDLDGVVEEEELSGGRVDIMCKEHGDSIYIFAVNMVDQAEVCRFSLDAPVSGTAVTVLDANRTLQIAGGAFTDTLPPFSVRKYAVPVSGSGVESPSGVPVHTLKPSVFPNPFVPGDGHSSIAFGTGAGVDVTVRVMSAGGRLVWQCVAGGKTEITWNGRELNGSTAAPGVYFYTVEDGRGAAASGRFFIGSN